jgi:hypothetical protein
VSTFVLSVRQRPRSAHFQLRVISDPVGWPSSLGVTFFTSGPGRPVPSSVRMKAPNFAMPVLSASARPRTVPVTVGWAFAQVRAARALVKKLM